MPNKIMARTILIETLNLSGVMGFEAIHEFIEEVMDLDHRLIRDRGQAYFYYAGIRAHSQPRDAMRRGAVVSGWAKTSR